MALDNLRVVAGNSRPVLVYELNEVPWTIIDWYISKNPTSNFAQLISLSRSYTSITSDVGELHPWVTWPTLHRGVNNTVHGIEFLNQDLTSAAKFPPIWETVAKTGKRVGVFGSLQSYPVPHDEAYAFYVPDTFAPSARTHPTKFQALQDLNLRQTARDGGIVSDVALDGSAIRIFAGLLRLGLSFRTIVQIVMQLISERVNAAYKTRRAVLQAPIAFDVFKHAYGSGKPDFCTFFTNHVAGMTHRYWRHALQSTEAEQRQDPVRAGNIGFAMDVADRQIGVLRQFADKSNGHLVILSSMGQAPVDRRGGDQIRINDVARFMKALGYNGPYSSHLAMHPDFNFGFANSEAAEQFASRVAALQFADGRSVTYKVHLCGSTVNVGLAQPGPRDREDTVKHSELEHELSFADAGLLRFDRDIGTAYHVPEGIVIWYDTQTPPDSTRKRIDSRTIRPMILAALDIVDPTS